MGNAEAAQVKDQSSTSTGEEQHFRVGQEYRRERLLQFVGSKQLQSGVLWGHDEPRCLICTSGGRHGKKAGYSDERLSDGSWWYFGQGTAGDQDLANAANKQLAAGQKSVLLFSTREATSAEVSASGSYGKLFQYVGSFTVAGYEIVKPGSGPRQNDSLIRFLLVPTDVVADASVDMPEPSATSLDALRTQLSLPPSTRIGQRWTLQEYRLRSALVHSYAISRANGVCEACNNPAPFLDGRGRGFLEVHHILRLADDGPDAPENVAAICPNCHRRAHHSSDRIKFSDDLKARISAVEKRSATYDVKPL